MFCVNCGTNMEDNAIFCVNCGQKVETINTEVSETASPVQSSISSEEAPTVKTPAPPIIESPIELPQIPPVLPIIQSSPVVSPPAPVIPQPLPNTVDQETRFCGTCGNLLRNDVEICPKCGIPTANYRKNDVSNNGYAQYNYEKQLLSKKVKNLKIGLAISIIIGVAALGIMGYAYYSLNNYIDYIKWDINQLQTSYNDLQNTYNKSKDVWLINITEIKIGNSDQGGRFINNPGDKIIASEIRYLTPYIIYKSNGSGEVTLLVKIISSNGEIMRNSSISPEGYSYSETIRITAGTAEQNYILKGWGNSEKSIYSSGNWTIEVWYKNFLLNSVTVTLSQ